MRFLSWALAAVAALSAAPALASKDAFRQLHARQVASAPLKLVDESYRSLTAAPRNYSAAVLLTALEPRLGCKMCREFGPEWDLLARSWVRGDRKGDSALIFGTLDFMDGREVFLSVCA